MALSLRWSSPLAVLALTSIAACTASSPQAQPPSATAASANGAASSDATANEPTTDIATTDERGHALGNDKPADTPPQSVITNEPPAGGTVTSNASPAPSGSDRMQAMMDLVKANRDGYRKCFDLWGKKNPGQAGKITFQFFLKVDGTLDKAAMKKDEGDLFAPEVETCMITFSKTLTYPASSAGRETTYTHRFEFKAAQR